MYTKFSMIRYYYTEITMASMNAGGMFKPLFFEFPDDTKALDAPQELNVMLGSALKLSVNSNTLNKNSTDFYFPVGHWCSVLTSNGTNTCFHSLG
jgi:alpha-glucosidase (family GH31 glycosyl hydrolase)